MPAKQGIVHIRKYKLRYLGLNTYYFNLKH